MRGIVLEGTTLKWPIFQAAALALLSGRHDLYDGGASGSESAPQPTSPNDHDPLDLSNVSNDPVESEISLEHDTGTPSLPQVTSLFSEGVSSKVTAPFAVLSGFKRTCSDADGELCVKKSRCNNPQDPWDSLCVASTSGNRKLENMFTTSEGCNDEEPTGCFAQTEVANTAQQHVVSANAVLMDTSDPLLVPKQELSPTPEPDKQWVTAWLDALDTFPAGDVGVSETFDCDDEKKEVNLKPQVAFYAEPSTLPNDGVWVQGALPVGDNQSMLGQEDQSVSSTSAEAPPMSSVSQLSQDHLVASAVPNAFHSGTSTSYSEHDGTPTRLLESRCDEEIAVEPTLESSASISDTIPLQALAWNGRAPSEGRSASYNAALKLLLSPDGAQGIPRWHMERPRTMTRHDLANAPYLSSSWLLERLVLQDTVPAYATELQSAFECYGYDNAPVQDLARRVLDLAYTLKHSRKVTISSEDRNQKKICLVWAAEIVRDAFFEGRPLRPNLRTYLRDKLKVEAIRKLQLPPSQGQIREDKGHMRRLDHDIRMVRRAINPKALWVSHPLNFISFLTDVRILLRTHRFQPKTVKRSSVSTSREPQLQAKKKRNVDVRHERLVGVLTKYKKLLKIDFAAEVKALLDVAPDKNGPNLLNNAVEEGYVPFDLLQNDIIKNSRIYSFNAHCLLGSLTALYRRLFEYTNETTERKTTDLKTSSDLEASGVDANESDACDGGFKLDVVQKYLLQPLPTEEQEGKSSVKAFDPLAAASEALEVWKQEARLSPSLPDMPNMPNDMVPFIRLYAPFGSSHWILSQLMDEHCKEEHLWRRNEFQCALDLCGYACTNSRDVFARAHVLAEAILTDREVPFNDADELLKLPRDSQAYFLAADIIHAALFQTWPQRRDLTSYSATQLRYEVLPEHMECLRKVMAEREKRHPCMEIRSQKGGKEVVVDWVRIQSAKNLSLEGIVDNAHPLSFDRFWKDVTLLNKGNHPAAPAVASKYRILFDRDIVEDLNSIREQSPQICYSDSFLEGIEEGYVPYRYAQLLAMSRSRTMLVNSNGLLLLGALVNYYVSLVDPANAIMSQETSTITPSQENPVTKTLPIRRRCRSKSRAPESKEQMAKLMAILREAPQQKLLEAPPQKPLIAGIATKLHPVAQYLLGHS